MNTTESGWMERAPDGGAIVEHDDVMAQFLRATAERKPQLLQVARRITNRDEDAEDILQDAFMKAYRALPNFRGEAKMSTWLTAIVRNTALEYRRGQRGRVFLPLEFTAGSDNDVVAMDFPDARPNPEESCERREMEALLHGEVKKLNRACRQVVERCLLQEQPQAEAAKALQLRVATVKARVFRAKRMLGQALTQYERPWRELRAAHAGSPN